jgi:hypothetical protein
MKVRESAHPGDESESWHYLCARTDDHLTNATQITLLNDGRALVVSSSDTEFYDLSTQRLTSTGAMMLSRCKFGGALLPDGRVLIAGGQVCGAWGMRVASSEIYDPESGRFLAGQNLNENRFKSSKAVVSLKDGRVLIAGGAEQPEVYDPTSGSFVTVGGMTLDRFLSSTATWLSDGRVLLAGAYMPSPAVRE